MLLKDPFTVNPFLPTSDLYGGLEDDPTVPEQPIQPHFYLRSLDHVTMTIGISRDIHLRALKPAIKEREREKERREAKIREERKKGARKKQRKNKVKRDKTRKK